MKKLTFATIFLFIITSPLFLQELPQGFYAYKLENGLELYVQEDFTIPTMRIEYSSKAGTGRQDKNSTGFFELYSRLFWKNTASGKSAYDAIGAGEFTSFSGFSQSRYSFVIPASQFSQSIKIFSHNLKNTLFTNNDIETEFKKLKQEVTTWSSSVPGFINASIDARIFSKEPWTKDSGVYPSLFSVNSIENVRQKLSEITHNWYVPDQSALFITGPISASSVLDTVQKHLSDWESSYIIGSTSDAKYEASAVQAEEEDSNRLFVLVSNDFSKDYIQAVIQYTAPGLGATNNFSATSWAAAEMMQTKLMEAGMTNTNTSFVADAADSRIIIQTLFDAQGLGEYTDVALMVPGFSNIVKSTAQLFTEQDLSAAKERAQLFRNDAYTGADAFISAVAANWAYGGVRYFFDWPDAVRNVSLIDVKQTFSNPWIFVLVHSDLYSKNMEKFANFGYTEITKNTGAWYSNNSENKNSERDLPVTQESAIFEYTSFTKSLINEYEISSGIPVVTQSIPSTPWTSLLVTFKGGDILHGEFKRGTEELAIENLSNNIEKEFSDLYFTSKIKTLPTIDNSTDVYYSNISIVCLSEDIQTIMNVVSKNIKKAEISIATADELFISSAYNWRIESGSLDYQLYAAGMETLFGGTEAQGLFNANTELMLKADYTDIKLASELLYDPNRISLIFTGNINNTLLDDIEKNFGTDTFYPVEKQYRAKIAENVEPIFSPFEQVVRLRHTFLTDVPASLAGNRPTKLIPTTDFSDPAHLYFEVPSFNDTENALFIALLYEVADRISATFENSNNAQAMNVSVIPGQGTYPVSSLRFSKVKSRDRLKNLVKNTFNDVVNELKTENNELVSVVKSRYTRILSREMLTLSDRSYLVWQGIYSSDNPSLYLEKFKTVEEATTDDFYNCFTSFLEDGEFFWLFSADTAN